MLRSTVQHSRKKGRTPHRNVRLNVSKHLFNEGHGKNKQYSNPCVDARLQSRRAPLPHPALTRLAVRPTFPTADLCCRSK